MAELAPGALIPPYRIVGLLGRGGMGSVYEAERIDGGERAALKTMNPAIAANPSYRKRFLREARAAAAVKHPSIVSIFEVLEHEGAPVIAMEMLQGESLEVLFRRRQKLPIDELARIFVHVTSVVGTAHALGIVHRDLKPENIFLTNSAPGVKVLDFGIAKLTATQGEAAATQALTATGAVLGTPHYMSPEQVSGEKHVDQRADIWALGIILYRGLSGILPTEGRSYAEVFQRVMLEDLERIETHVPDVPADVAALVHRMLSRPREDRPWDLREVYAVLESHAGEHALAFEEAVLPVWSEETNDTPASKSAGAPSAPLAPPPWTPIELMPGAISRPGFTSGPGQGAGSTGRVTPPSATGGGTVILDEPSARGSAPPSPSPPPIARGGGLGVSPDSIAPEASPEPATTQHSLATADRSSANTLVLVIAVLVALGAASVLFLKLRG